MDNAWKDKLRERFSDYSVPEPEGLWEGIEQGIAGKKRSKVIPVWWLSGGLAAAAAAVAQVVLLPSTKEHPVNEPVSVLADAGKEDAPVLETVPEEQEVSPEAPVVPSVRPVAPVASRRPLLAENVTVSEIVVDEPVPAESEATLVEALTGADKAAHAEQATDSVDQPEAVSGPEVVETYIPEVFPDEEKPGRAFTVGVYREGGQDAGEASQGYGLANTGDYLTKVTNDANTDPAGLVRMLSANRASTFDATHHAPVRVGVTVSWSFLPWLSLSSGLNWTALSSEFEESTASTRTVTRQDLGYLGVPLRLEAGWQPWKGLRLYAGAGGMAETCLLASSKTESYIGDHWEGTVTSKPDAGGLLWSVGVSAGAEYRFNRHMGVYLAPGLEYHFDNGSTARSAYTEKPLHYNVSLGLRFNFGE